MKEVPSMTQICNLSSLYTVKSIQLNAENGFDEDEAKIVVVIDLLLAGLVSGPMKQPRML